MRRSGGTPTRAGWRSSCRSRWSAWRTGRTAGTGCQPQSHFPTGAMRSPPRRPAARSAMTSATTRPAAGGTSTRAGRPRPDPRHRWTSCGSTRLAVDLNPGHLAAWAVTPDGNPAGPPVTIPIDLAGLPAATRDGRLRAAISSLIRLARQLGCRAVVIEDLDFADALEQGRERAGSRPSRGRRGRGFRRLVSGIPAGKFRDRLAQMASNAGLAVIVVDPAYTSRWGREHWLAPLQDHAYPIPASGHHAAAVVIGRRALGHRARRRAGVTGGGQRTSRRRATPKAPVARRTTRNGRPRQAQRQPLQWRKTASANRTRPPDQATQDRSGPPARQDHVPLADQERFTTRALPPYRRTGSAMASYRPWPRTCSAVASPG
jgi:IS605 OrfB family transposase